MVERVFGRIRNLPVAQGDETATYRRNSRICSHHGSHAAGCCRNGVRPFHRNSATPPLGFTARFD